MALRAAFDSSVDTTLVLVIERSVVDWWRQQEPEWPWERLLWVEEPPGVDDEIDSGSVLACAPPVEPHAHRPGEPDEAGAAAALAAIDLASTWALEGQVDALVTAPVSKAAIASIEPGFRGHTDYLAVRAGRERYGRDYLMAFLGEELNVALHSVHLPLREALERITREAIVDGLKCLAQHQPGMRIAVAGLNPHAGEDGLLGSEEVEIVAPAVSEARELGIDASGPWSPDTVFVRARPTARRPAEFDWVYALYHDQGLIAVKTLDFGSAVNWTVGLPYVRVSVDHGTAFDIAGSGEADHRPMLRAIREAASLVDGLPNRPS